jgi:hypothetical protein
MLPYAMPPDLMVDALVGHQKASSYNGEAVGDPFHQSQ